MQLVRSVRFWRLSALAVSLLLVGGAVGVAVAGGGAEVRSGTAIKAVKILRSAEGGSVDLGTTSPAVVGSTTINVPANTKAILLITFSAETSCYDASGWCGLDILVNGTPARPNSDFAFDSSDGGVETISSYESHSIQRSTNVLTAGTYTVIAQFYNGSGGPTIRWDDWHLTIERILKPS